MNKLISQKQRLLYFKKKLNNSNKRKKSSLKFLINAIHNKFLDQAAIKILTKSKNLKIGNLTIKKSKIKRMVNKQKENIITIIIKEDIMPWGVKKEDQEPKRETKIK